MPMKASKGSVLRTLVLEEQRALLRPELLQVAATWKKHKATPLAGLKNVSPVSNERTKAKGKARRRVVSRCRLL